MKYKKISISIYLFASGSLELRFHSYIQKDKRPQNTSIRKLYGDPHILKICLEWAIIYTFDNETG